MRPRLINSGLEPDEPSNDWFSDALTPESMKKTPAEDVLPIEVGSVEEDHEQAAGPKNVATMAIHAELMERFNQIMEG